MCRSGCMLLVRSAVRVDFFVRISEQSALDPIQSFVRTLNFLAHGLRKNYGRDSPRFSIQREEHVLRSNVALPNRVVSILIYDFTPDEFAGSHIWSEPLLRDDFLIG